jgi:hypothetical protein
MRKQTPKHANAKVLVLFIILYLLFIFVNVSKCIINERNINKKLPIIIYLSGIQNYDLNFIHQI